MKSIDIKSLIIGILGTALVMVLMGQSSMNKQYDVECVYETGFLESPRVLCRRFDLTHPEPFNKPPQPGTDTAIWYFSPDFILKTEKKSSPLF